jgi:hypothetical protein
MMTDKNTLRYSNRLIGNSTGASVVHKLLRLAH